MVRGGYFELEVGLVFGCVVVWGCEKTSGLVVVVLRGLC